MMSESVDSVVEKQQENVALSPVDPLGQPEKGLREDLIGTAVKFLQNPKVRQSPFVQRRAFLERKGLTKAEIDLAVYRSGTGSDEHTVAPGNQNGGPTPHNTMVPYAAANVEPPSTWTRVKDSTSLIVIAGVAVYAAYQFYDKYLAPVWSGGKKSSELQQSLDDLKKNMAEVASSLTETQQLMRNQQRSLDDIVRANSFQRGPEEMGRMSLADVKDEIKSLKALLLSKNQFPALPTTTPVIPSWQLQQSSISITSKSTENTDVVIQAQNTKIEKAETAPAEDGANATNQTTAVLTAEDESSTSSINGDCNGHDSSSVSNDHVTETVN